MNKYVCSECGKEFTLTYSSEYMYKVVNVSKTSEYEKTMYQCSYTCYDHAKLRSCRIGHVPLQKQKEYIENSENTMRVQGKKILHPIKI